MADIVIKTENKPEEKANTEDIKETLNKADEYKKLKEENDKIEAEVKRREELSARLNMSGRAQAGQYVKPKTPEEIADEEAKKLLAPFGK